MNDVKALVRKVLRDGFVLNLGIADNEGPWVASVVYVFDDQLSLYWISQPSSRHSQAIAASGKVAGTIVAEHATDKERALQLAGTAVALPEEASLAREQALQKKRGMPIPAQAGDILKDGYQWYKLTPDRIELIQNELFGYERQCFLVGK